MALISCAVHRLGHATALRLAQEGATIAINTRRSIDKTNFVKAGIETLNVKVGFYVADITDEAPVNEMATRMAANLGPEDILINNAANPSQHPMLHLSLEKFHRIIDIIISGAFLCLKTCLPNMEKLDWRILLNLSEVGNHAGFAERAYVHIDKGAIEAIVRPDSIKAVNAENAPDKCLKTQIMCRLWS